MKTIRIQFLMMALVSLSVGCGGEFEQNEGTQDQASSEVGEIDAALCNCIIGNWSDYRGDVIVTVDSTGRGTVTAVKFPYRSTWPLGSGYWQNITDGAPTTNGTTKYTAMGYGGGPSNGPATVPMNIVVTADKNYLTESSSNGYTYTWYRIP